MPKLEVKMRYAQPDTIPARVSLQVENAVAPPTGRKVPGGEYDSFPPPLVLASRIPWSLGLPVTLTRKVAGYFHHGESSVLFVKNSYDNHVLYRPATQLLQVLNAAKSDQRYIKPANDTTTDQDQDSTSITEVNLDLDISYDSFFKFVVSSDDGIRAVLDESDVVIPSETAGYEVEASRIGDPVQRKVITNSDFQLTLKLKPTIVKNTSSR